MRSQVPSATGTGSARPSTAAKFQVLTHVLIEALDTDPLYLDEDELRRCLIDQLERIVYLSTTGYLERAEREESPLWDRALRAAMALDARGALAGVPPDKPADDVRGWAIERVANLGGLVYGKPTNVLGPWLESKAVDTLIAGGQGVVPKTALRRASAGWSWSQSAIADLYRHAFPPPEEQTR